MYDVRHLRNNFYCEAVMIQGNLRTMTKFLFCISYFSWSEIIGFGIERRAMMVVQTFYLKPSCGCARLDQFLQGPLRHFEKGGASEKKNFFFEGREGGVACFFNLFSQKVVTFFRKSK